jgi:hypothetical protein
MNRLFDLLLSSPCSHEFSWPRKTAAGAYYQVCLRCGDHYWYDWKKMRRTKPIDPAEQLTLAQPVRTRWSPRARRFQVAIETEFRRKSSDVWLKGSITNVSQSGVLFTATPAVHLSRHAALELMFEMPSDISGQPHSSVLCDAYVVRNTVIADASSIAAAILEYKFLHNPQPPASVSASAAGPADESVTETEPLASSSALTHRRRFRMRKSRTNR